MCKAIIQQREADRFDLEMHYCQLPDPPRNMLIEHIGTYMTDRAEAVRRAEAKYDHYDCAKRFGCKLTWEERQPKPIQKKEEFSFFDQAAKHRP